jgi:hypothetical protein
VLYATPDNNIFFVINTIQKNKIVQWDFSALRDTTQKNSALYPTTPQVFFRSTPQWKRFSSIVGYNRKGFPPLWDTMEEVFLLWGIQRRRFSSIVGYNRRGFFCIVGYNRENDTMQNDIFLNFKCLSLPSNKNLGKISYLNSQTNLWKELIMTNYIVSYEENFVSIGGYTTATIFNLNNLAKINFSAK